MKERFSSMKWLFVGVGVVCASVGILAALKALRDTIPENTDCMDGGVRHYNSGEDSPKVIESTEITEFHCEFSLYSIADPMELENGRYQCEAVLQDGAAACRIKWHDRYGNGDNRTFEADGTFLKKLDEIVRAHDLARYNGYRHSVSGLPDMYGVSLDIVYASGESVYAYDNQNVFLPAAALKDLFDLFTSQNET